LEEEERFSDFKKKEKYLILSQSFPCQFLKRRRHFPLSPFTTPLILEEKKEGRFPSKKRF